MKRALIVALLAACGDDAAPPVTPDATTPDAVTSSWAGSYSRVVPGYDDVATCRAQNPDPIVNCTEILSLCADGRVSALYTDIISGGTWTDLGARARVMLTDNSFSMDGDFELTRQADGAVSSSEIYGDRAFTPDAESSLCP